MQTYAAAVTAAANRIGSDELLARHLRTPLAPQLHFMRCVEVIVADEEQLEKFRRAAAATQPLVLDAATCSVTLKGRQLRLPITEWSVLESLSARMGQVVSRAQIRRELALWSGKALADAIHMYVFRLRLKLEPEGVRIRTIPRNGYVLSAS